MLGEFIKKQRTMMGLTQTECANKLKITNVHLCSIERGKMKAGPKVIRAVSKFFKINIVEVVKMNEDNEQV